MENVKPIDRLTGCHIEACTPEHRERAVRALRSDMNTPRLILDTCQRFEVYGYDIPELGEGLEIIETYTELNALEHFARIAAGLESRTLGELEIMGQVRTAYKMFHAHYGPAALELDRIFQEGVALGRRARKASGIDANLTSLGALAARELVDRMGPNDPVAVIGSGSLASTVARYLGKRGKMPIRVASRCPDNALNLAMECGGFATGLDNLAHLLDDVAGVITATAAPHPILFPEHLSDARDEILVVDLGEPADCCKSIANLEHVDYLDLIEIESRSQSNTEDRQICSERAGEIIKELVREKYA
jgi:glutamyl-tRNA reductase